MRVTSLALLCALAAACGAIDANSELDGSVQPDAVVQQDALAPPPTPNAHVRGVVYAPMGNTFTPPLTVTGALVYVADAPPAAIPQTVYCERCEDLPPAATYVFTDEYGDFDLNIWDGAFVLVIQKGQFRLIRPIVVAKNQVLDLGPEDTTLPSKNSDDGNDTIPRIALLGGSYDQLEDLFAKVGFADLSGSNAVYNANTHFDVYNNGGNMPPASSGRYKGTAHDFLSDLNAMMSYHIIFVPCSAEAGGVVSDATVQQNVRDYVKAGGKYYVADWSYDYLRQVYLTRDDGPIVNFDGAGPSTLGSANDVSSSFDSLGHAVDTKLYAWLEAQQTGWGGSTTGANALDLKENWDAIMSLDDGYIGDDPESGLKQYGKADVIVEGPHSDNEGQSWQSLPASSIFPLTIGFPSGCGRVLYTTYHTVGAMGSGHTGIEVQERILIYLIMEIGVCQSGPILQ
jgi:hypothetical protein